MENITLFGQIISVLDRNAIKKNIRRRATDKHQKGFGSWPHLIAMLFCHFANSESVRDISNGLHSATGNLNHFGIDRDPPKSTLSYQNKCWDWKLFRDYYYQLLRSFGQHWFHNKKGVYLGVGLLVLNIKF